ncbi:Uncharacterised protein [BD1-7 clade bacterium]|uniref:Uncharacterized protein n=1 Tax=BD1-7 clade bacterium TaxID=2029982 RepID=A0A5S9NVQ9_9GAMM|nr:Uncharacterised protein [BD1-7 clade bacterium]CAA0110098.1 Uncharacterised protein [BD1-7 clade bacterium]
MSDLCIIQVLTYFPKSKANTSRIDLYFWCHSISQSMATAHLYEAGYAKVTGS